MHKVSLREKLDQITEHWAPKVVGQVETCHIKLVKLSGEFVWHSHPHEDEMFLVIEGDLVMRFRDREVALAPGEFIIVPKGVEHQPFAPEEASVMLFEPVSTVNTGDVGGPRTRAAEQL